MTNNLSSCNIDVVEELNGRILERNNGYGTNNVLLGQRSQPTKYVLPLDTIKPNCNTPILNMIRIIHLNQYYHLTQELK